MLSLNVSPKTASAWTLRICCNQVSLQDSPNICLNPIFVNSKFAYFRQNVPWPKRLVTGCKTAPSELLKGFVQDLLFKDSTASQEPRYHYCFVCSGGTLTRDFSHTQSAFSASSVLQNEGLFSSVRTPADKNSGPRNIEHKQLWNTADNLVLEGITICYKPWNPILL